MTSTRRDWLRLSAAGTIAAILPDGRSSVDPPHVVRHEADSGLAEHRVPIARIGSFELAFRMQAQALAVFDLGNETEATKRMYGIGLPASDPFGKECLLARRLVENGVRFVQIFDTLPPNTFQPWDYHRPLPSRMQKESPVINDCRQFRASMDLFGFSVDF